MITLLAVVLWAVLAAIAVLHAAWGLGSHWPCESEESLVRTTGGTPGAKRMYPPSACFTVAAMLAGVSAWPLFAAGLLPAAWPSWLTLLAGAAIATVFIVRGIAGYVSAWRRLHSAEPFATLDRHIYAPLCFALGTGFIILLLRGSQ
jgi:TRAP-type C4-dicarboxylate transport system permease large subunit